MNGNLFFIKEYISVNEHLYLYHWQMADGTLMTRWDNSPHHREIETFPHHKHNPNLEKSYETTFEKLHEVIKTNFIRKN
ncbi:MAG: hypothetical protein GF311_21825 [Candidatus Lokiarchaeota archaeon]|nr:hypothetical protein [Candidatus Lokiarchaeota archaeon]